MDKMCHRAYVHNSGCCCTGMGAWARRLLSMVLIRGHVAPPPGPNPSNETSAAAKRPRADKLAGTATESAPAPRAAYACIAHVVSTNKVVWCRHQTCLHGSGRRSKHGTVPRRSAHCQVGGCYKPTGQQRVLGACIPCKEVGRHTHACTAAIAACCPGKHRSIPCLCLYVIVVKVVELFINKTGLQKAGLQHTVH